MEIALGLVVIGAIVYMICAETGKAASIGELGRLAFFAGLLAIVFGR